ncbi:MAG TPA: hypothetical protein VE825_14175 [Terriglobales bacterium]|jgi:hypothetical protein|nr:hypothetical protein [Terriglobales bacterium]
MRQSVSRTGRLRQALAWLALLAVVSFVALDAVHSHHELADNASPHSRCELCLTLHAPALRTAVITLPFSTAAQPLRAGAAPNLLSRVPFSDFFIRPPPAA